MLLKYPHEILQTKATDFMFPDDMKYVHELVESATTGFGWGNLLGLAAPQIGIPKKLFIAQGKIYINPEIIEKSEMTSYHHEGCYSLEENKFDYKTMRHDAIKLKWQDTDQNWHEQIFNGIAARIIQHEQDHLEGKLCCDYSTDFTDK